MYMPSLDCILDQFEKDHDDRTGWTRNLREAINASPVLRECMEHAVGQGHLTGFALSRQGAVENNAYSLQEKKILLNKDTIRSARPGSAAVGELVFALGHETDHALRSEENLKASATFDAAVRRIGESTGVRFHDYTQPLQTMLDARRTDEAKAHLGGFNAYLSWVATNVSDFSTENMQKLCPHRMDDFLTARLQGASWEIWFKDGLTFDFDRGLVQSLDNVEAMKGYYYDKGGDKARLGRSRTLDYRHYDASGLLDVIHAKDETLNYSRDPATHQLYRKRGTPQIVVDLDALGLERSRLETRLSFATPQPNRGRDIATTTEEQDRKRKREPEQKDQGAPRADPVGQKRARTVAGGDALPDPATGGRPGANHPFYLRAIELLRDNPKVPQMDAVTFDNVAAGIAFEASHKNWSVIHMVTASPDGRHVFALDREPGPPPIDEIHIDIAQWQQRSAADTLAKLAALGPSQATAGLTHHQSIGRP